jgi:hypothetical protein
MRDACLRWSEEGSNLEYRYERCVFKIGREGSKSWITRKQAQQYPSYKKKMKCIKGNSFFFICNNSIKKLKFYMF